MAWLAGGAGISFGLALGLLAAFFITRDARLDRLSEWAFVVFAILATPTILAVGDRLGDRPAITAITAAGIVAVLAVGLSELAMTRQLVDFRRLAPVVSVAFLGFIAWIALASLFVLTGSSLPTGLGWLGIAAVALGAGVTGLLARRPGVLSGEQEPDRRVAIMLVVPLVGIVAWMVWLGTSL